MKAIMLAAGLGIRLSGGDDTHAPKCLLRFDSKTLLRRHIETLQALDIEKLVLVTGYHADEIEAEIGAIGARDYVRMIPNADFRQGSVVSLWTAREELRGGTDILFMDADVLYAPILLERLMRSTHGNCFLIDRGFEPGEEPVKICLRNGTIVEFRKRIDVAHDTVGEWPGFLRLSPATAARIADATETYIDAGRRDHPYEESFRNVVLNSPPGAFGVEDITGIPWIEIDFPEDLIRAERDILPRLRIS